MAERIVIIHGWSDSSESFKKLREKLCSALAMPASMISLANYESREDNITFQDVISGFHKELIKRGIIKADGTSEDQLNIIVHSTGGLIIRYWIWEYFTSKKKESPVIRILMLAPANFGSPLAIRGQSFLGTLSKGRWKIGDFLEVGKKLLIGLELASPFQWELAHRDLLDSDAVYHPNKILTTILVGRDDYKGIKGWVNKAGTDGTVVISGTNLNSEKVIFDYRENCTEKIRWYNIGSRTDTAFGVLPGFNHGSIVDKAESDPFLFEIIKKALTIRKGTDFQEFKRNLKDISGYGRTGIFQQFFVKVEDNFGEPVYDYTLEFSLQYLRAGKSVESDEETLNLQEILIKEASSHSQDKSYRRFLIPFDELKELIGNSKQNLNSIIISIHLNVHLPRIDKKIYYKTKGLENLEIYNSEQEEKNRIKLFYEDTTTLVHIFVDRTSDYVELK